MGADYIPEPDADAMLWMKAFADGLVADRWAFMIAPAQAARIQAAVQDFSARLMANSPELRTRATTIEKNDARSVAENLCRFYAQQIKQNRGIDDALKVSVGVPPINPGKRRIECPQTSPLLNIVGCTPSGQHILRFSDSASPERRAKPFGAASLQLFVYVGDVRSADRSQAQFRGAFTKNPIVVPFEPDEGGKYAVYFARWMSRRCETGPWSNAISLRIAA